MELIKLPQNRDDCRAAVKTVLNFYVSEKTGNIFRI